jgi:hypothetical protein
MDAEGIHLISAIFEKPILHNISELDLNMSQNVAEFNTFDINLMYNKFNIELELD